MTVKQIQHRIRQTKAALEREHIRNVEKVASVGWGAGMRRVKVGPSFRREFELESRLRDYERQLEELEKQLQIRGLRANHADAY